MKTVDQPRVYLIARQAIDRSELDAFLADHDLTWQTDTDKPAEQVCEIAGRLCYMSYGKGRKTNAQYLHHLLEVGHGSVLEHAVFSFLIVGASRSFTHELIRHRAGFAYSQLSQRYVDESDAPCVEPDCIADNPATHEIFHASVEQSQQAYNQLVEKLMDKFDHVDDRTLRRKMARQAARSVLPNAVETRIFVTANARALRNFIELRANEAADVEIRKIAVKIVTIMQTEAPNLFGDYQIYTLPDGTEAAKTAYRKV